MRLYFCNFLFLFFINSCFSPKIKPESLGNISECLLVCPSALFSEKIVKDFVKIISSEQYGLPQPEPLFKVHYVKDIHNNIFHERHRFIINLYFNKDFNTVPQYVLSSASKSLREKGFYFGIVKNPRSFPQVEVWLLVSKNESWLEYLELNKAAIVSYLLSIDRKLLLQNLSKSTQNVEAIKVLKDSLNVSIPILPGDYNIKVLRPNWAWLNKDLENGSLNLILWKSNLRLSQYPLSFKKRPKTLNSDFFFSHVLNERNKFLSTNIPGPSQGSFYTSETLLPIIVDSSFDRFNHSFSSEDPNLYLRGLWKMHGDFMGGPFVHRFFVDNDSSFHLEAFVYSPNQPKRVLLRELECLIGEVSNFVL